MLRGVALLVGLLAALPAMANEMGVEEARRFVMGKTFTYTCFEGTRGQGRILHDGSVVGSIQIRGDGPVRYARLPPGTIRVANERVCASVRGLPIEPCFNLRKIDDNSFRGSISGLGFAACEFARHNPRATVAQSTEARETRAPRETRQPREAREPLRLRPSITAGNN